MPAYSVADSSSRGTRCPGGSITRRRGWCEDPSTGSGRRSCSPAEHITSAGPVAWQHRGELLAPVRSLFGAPVNGHCFTTTSISAQHFCLQVYTVRARPVGCRLAHMACTRGNGPGSSFEHP